MTESINTLSLGQQLKQAREALGFSIEDVAKKTNLKKSHIESLESDIFILQSVAPTFVRGYVRNYVRFLRLPEELVSSVNYGEVTIPKTATIKTPSPKAQQKSQNKWVKYLTIAVLLGAIGMTLLWWYQDYQQEQENREHFVTSAMPATTEATAETTENNAIQLPAQPSAQPTVQTEEATVAQTIPTENMVTVAEEPKAETAVEAPVEMPKADVMTETQPVAETMPTVEQPVNVLQPNPETAETETAQSTAIGNDELRIEITGKESWITVKNATSKKSLAEKLYANGEVLTFNGNEQYRLTIGAPANVKLYYKGQEVPLKIDGRVARIKLPLAQ